MYKSEYTFKLFTDRLHSLQRSERVLVNIRFQLLWYIWMVLYPSGFIIFGQQKSCTPVTGRRPKDGFVSKWVYNFWPAKILYACQNIHIGGGQQQILIAFLDGTKKVQLAAKKSSARVQRISYIIFAVDHPLIEYSDRRTRFLLAKNYKPTWTKTSLRLVFVLRWNKMPLFF